MAVQPLRFRAVRLGRRASSVSAKSAKRASVMRLSPPPLKATSRSRGNRSCRRGGSTTCAASSATRCTRRLISARAELHARRRFLMLATVMTAGSRSGPCATGGRGGRAARRERWVGHLPPLVRSVVPASAVEVHPICSRGARRPLRSSSGQERNRVPGSSSSSSSSSTVPSRSCMCSTLPSACNPPSPPPEHVPSPGPAAAPAAATQQPGQPPARPLPLPTPTPPSPAETSTQPLHAALQQSTFLGSTGQRARRLRCGSTAAAALAACMLGVFHCTGLLPALLVVDA
jgi:hypothetical protein